VRVRPLVQHLAAAANDVVHRRIHKFNSETLIDMLARLGVRLELHVAARVPYKRWNFPQR